MFPYLLIVFLCLGIPLPFVCFCFRWMQSWSCHPEAFIFMHRSSREAQTMAAAVLLKVGKTEARLPYFIQVANKSVKVGRYCPFAFSSFVALCGNDLVSLPFFRFGKFQMIKSNLGHSLSPLPSWCGKGIKLVENMLFPALLKTIWICYLNNLGGPLRSSFI